MRFAGLFLHKKKAKEINGAISSIYVFGYVLVWPGEVYKAAVFRLWIAERVGYHFLQGYLFSHYIAE